MKKLLKVLLALAACSAALCVTAAAVEADGSAPVKVWGKVSPWDGEGIFLKNDNKDDPMSEVVLQTGGGVCAVNAATGLPLDLEMVKEGDTLYAWIGPAATMSLPPHVFPKVIVGGVPEGGAVPEYCEIAGNPQSGENGELRLPVLGGETLTVTEKTAYTPWRTRQIVRAEDLVPGARVLVWKDAAGKAEKVLVFAYPYRGYVNQATVSHGHVLLCLNGNFIGGEDAPQFLCKRGEGGTVLAPLRAVAEAAGYDVVWDKNRGAVVQDENVDPVFYVWPGEEVVCTPEGEAGISAPCVLENGVTYLPAEDLCYWLNLFFVNRAE